MSDYLTELVFLSDALVSAPSRYKTILGPSAILEEAGAAPSPELAQATPEIERAFATWFPEQAPSRDQKIQRLRSVIDDLRRSTEPPVRQAADTLESTLTRRTRQGD